MKDVAHYCPKGKKDWRQWLARNHHKEEGVWLMLYKLKSPEHNLSWSDAVDEALCFGWIDSTKKTIDADKYKQYFCPRKAKSIWSKINKDKVSSLIEQGLMEKAGYKSIERAKENGSWHFYDEVEALVVPEDLKREFEQYTGARAYFDSLSKSHKKALLYWVISAKRAETRQKRISDLIENASRNLKPKPFR